MEPEEIKEEDLPLIVFSDKTSGLLEFIIKFRTKGDYNHVMWSHRVGFFASQGNTYSEAPLGRYMKTGNRLKYFQVLNLTAVQRKLIIESINKKLKRPFWQKKYDWLGIAGQALGLTWINTPWLDYCSEDVPQHLKYMAEKSLNEDTPLYKIIMGIPKHTSPEALNEYLKKYPEHFKIYGKWEEDDDKSLNLAFI